MSITLFCRNTTSNAFSVKISKDEPISELKKVIKAENTQTFANVDAKDIKLWKVEISGDHDDQLGNLSFQDSDELLAIRKILKYFPDSPAEEHIHVLVEPPASTATSDEVLKLREEVASMQELLNKSVHEFDIVVKPKQKANKWTVNIEQGTLSDLKDYICELYKPPVLENDRAVLNFMNNERKYYPRNDVAFREMLRSLVSKNNLKFTVFIETPSKLFNKWTFPKVCQLYGLSDDPNPIIDVYPVFKCGCVDTKNEKYGEALRKLFDELETRVATTPIDVSYEATKSIYSYSFLASATFPLVIFYSYWKRRRSQ